MKLEIDRNLKTPVYIQIADQIRRQIQKGEIPAGQRLPSERRLAEALSVNRTTVLNAYAELKAEGYLGAQVGNGTVVQDTGSEAVGISNAGEPVWNQLFSGYASRFDSGLVGELLALASRPDFISFATGIASPDSGPAEVLAGMEEALSRRENSRALLHSPTEGFMSMRQAICTVMQKRGVFCSEYEVMMLSGSQQGIDLAARVFLDPGDIVVIEEPTYFPAIEVFKTAGARIMTVPIDEDGMNIEVLERLLERHRPKLIYTIPTYQNPTGTTMSLERRRRLLDLAQRSHTIVLEDDAYGGITFDGESPPLLKALDSSGYVVYLSTFSKNVYSGLRLGWMVADRRIVKAFSNAKQLADLHSSSLSQWLVERFVSSGGLENHMKKMSCAYKERRDIMHGALKKYAPAGMTWTVPTGGYYIWCRLPEGVSAGKLVRRAAEYKVSFVPGVPFFYTEAGDEYLRLNFTFAPKDVIDDGIQRLMRAVKALLGEVSDRWDAPPADISPII